MSFKPAMLMYHLGIRCYTSMIGVAAFFGNRKAQSWLKGRQNWTQRYQYDWAHLNPERQVPTVWIHCASLGEFEQGRPLIEALRARYPALKIVLSFFSPSGYNIRKKYEQADYVCYLPIDSQFNAQAFVNLFQPDLVIFIKYEFWLYYLRTLHEQHIPILLVSAAFRSQQIFFQPWGGPFRQVLPRFRHIFVQDPDSAQLLEKLGLSNYSLAGDTRVDRVAQIAKEAPAFPLIEAFAQSHHVLIGGSTWPSDEAILLPFINKQLPADWKVIIAPHDISESHLQQIEKKLSKKVVRYSQASKESVASVQVLLIDNIGMLSALYRYGRIAYIGGGFGAGIHNILEPVAFGLPVVFGPRYRKFAEARYLVRAGGAFAIQNTNDWQDIFYQLASQVFYDIAASKAWNYMQYNRGATHMIMNFVQQNELLSGAVQ